MHNENPELNETNYQSVSLNLHSNKQSKCRKDICEIKVSKYWITTPQIVGSTN